MNWLLLKNSLLVSSLTTLLALGFGFLAALWLACLPSRWQGRFLALAVMALALPPFLVTNCWLHYLGHTGLWQGWLPLNLFSLGGTVWILGLLLWPIPLLAVWSAWHRLEPAQLESDMAVTGWALIRALLWPLARPALAQAAVLTFVLALNNFAVPALLQVKVSPAEMWVRFSTAFDTLGALALSWPLVLGPLLLLLWFSRREFPWPRREAPVRPRLLRQQLGRAWFASSGVATLLLCGFSVGLPLFQLLALHRTWTELPGAVAAGQTAIWNSLLFASASATLIILAALAFSSFIVAPSKLFRISDFGSQLQNPRIATKEHRDHKESLKIPGLCVLCDLFWLILKSALGFRISPFLWLPFLLPGILLGIGLIALFNHRWSAFFYQSVGIVILALVIRYLALGWSAVAHAARTTDPELTDVARLDGATRWQMLRFVLWPQIARQVLAAWYIVFLLCLWDVESMILVYPPGGETLALRIFNLLHYGYNAQVNALCLTLLLLALMPLLLWRLWSLARNAWPFLSAQPACRMLLAFIGLLLLQSACTAPSSSNEAAVHSPFFSRVQLFGTRGVGVGQLNKPRSVAVDSQDNFYVVDMTGRVQKFSSNGVFLLSWQMPQTDLGKPKGMCRDRAGNILVLEPHYARVNQFSPAGTLLTQWGQKGTNVGQLSLPRAVAVNSQGELFLSEYQEMERVQKFGLEPAARCLAAFGKAGIGPGEFNRPEGLCVDAQDRVYVADSCNHRIQVFSREGRFLRAYGKPGRGKGELSYPYDICVDAAGRQYVCEFGNSRIQIFDDHDQPLEILGGPGAEPGQFANPWGVALDSAGNLYVADSQNHRVQKFLRRQ